MAGLSSPSRILSGVGGGGGWGTQQKSRLYGHNNTPQKPCEILYVLFKN